VHKSKIKQISLAVCLAFMPFTGYAAGLGKLNINSGLGEPLKADIELLSVTPEELSSLVAVIASEDAYAAQGIARLSIHNNIKVEIAKNPDGSPILKLRSSKPISDPYLDMLIQVDWATGRLQREYTVLLDPPGYNQAVDGTATPVTPPSASMRDIASSRGQASSSNLDTTRPSIKKSRKQPRTVGEMPASQKKSVEKTDAQDVTTKRGDTLSSVARDMQVEGVSLDQMLVGLYESNKDAFLNGNMNRLKVGQIIKVPTKESLTAIDAQQARQSIKVHSTNWNAYRNTLAGSVEKAPALVETEQKQSGSGKIATAEDKAAPAKVGPQDVVKLSAGEKDASKAAKDASKAFDAKIVALQEETSAREKSLKEAKDRTAALEKQIQDMQKLLALKSQSMSQLQKNAETAAKAPDVKTETAELAKTQDAPKVATSPAVEIIKPLEKAPAVIPEIKKVEPASHVKTPPEPQPEPSFLEGLMNSVDLVVLGAVSGIALLGAGWMFLRNKRRKDLDSFERGILTSGGLRANTVFGNTTGNASTSDTSFLTDFSQNADGSMIDTNDVDPIAEAEVYMAYGRDAQAEEILKDAISKEPKRYELHLKLLEMYAGRKDTAAFETIAGELYTTLGANNPTWAKVAEMGAVLEPENPLYAVSNIVATDALTTQKSDVAGFSTSAVSADSDLDFSFNTEPETVVEDANSAVMQSFSEAKDDGQEISFDLGTLNATTDSASLDSTDSGKSIAGSIPEDVISFESADVNQPVEGLGSHVAFSSNADADNSMDFDLGDLTTEVPVATAAPVQSAVLDVTNDSPALDAAMMSNDNFSAAPADSESAGSESPDLDLDFMLPTEDVKNELEHQPEVASSALDDISFDLDFALDEPTASAPVASTPVKQADNDGMEISFDLPESPETKESVTSNSTASQENNHEANTFDLSSISLDLGETESELFTESPAPAASVEPEPQDVNVKLDLVAAYIDMDDKEGARELLEEVMKEGGTTQKARAQQLLDSLA
jgi:pilus assembly protein FimV